MISKSLPRKYVISYYILQTNLCLNPFVRLINVSCLFFRDQKSHTKTKNTQSIETTKNFQPECMKKNGKGKSLGCVRNSKNKLYVPK